MAVRFLATPTGWTFAAVDGGAETETGPPEDREAEFTGPRGCGIYSAESLYEAQLVLDLLEEAGIAARLFNEHLIGAMGELPFIETSPKIWLVDDRDRETARTVIDAYEARRREPVKGTRHCHACEEDSPGNFELCWRCREPFETE